MATKLRRTTIVDVELLARNGYHGFVYVDQNPAQIAGFSFAGPRARTAIARRL